MCRGQVFFIYIDEMKISNYIKKKSGI